MLFECPTAEPDFHAAPPPPSPPPAVATHGRAPSPDDSDGWADSFLVHRLARGDAGALRELHERYAPALLAFLHARIGRGGQAEEVLQETFLQAWQSARRYDPAIASPRTWLFVLARSRALDRLRSSGARSRRERSFVRSRDDGPAEPAGTSRLEAEERKARLERAMRHLPLPQRRCLELAYWGGLSHRQVAEHLQQPLGTVKSRILVGLKKLRSELAAC